MSDIGKLSKRASFGPVDEIFRVSKDGVPLEHLGDNVYRNPKTGEVYTSKGSVSNQTKQDQMLYPYSA